MFETREYFLQFSLLSTRIRVKMITENAAFKNVLQSGDLCKCRFASDYVTVFDPSSLTVYAHVSINHYCVFVCTGKNDSKTQRVDADFWENGAKFSLSEQ